MLFVWLHFKQKLYITHVSAHHHCYVCVATQGNDSYGFISSQTSELWVVMTSCLLNRKRGVITSKGTECSFIMTCMLTVSICSIQREPLRKIREHWKEMIKKDLTIYWQYRNIKFILFATYNSERISQNNTLKVSNFNFSLAQYVLKHLDTVVFFTNHYSNRNKWCLCPGLFQLWIHTHLMLGTVFTVMNPNPEILVSRIKSLLVWDLNPLTHIW